TIRLAPDAFVDPLQFRFQLLRRLVCDSEDAHSTRLRYLGDDVATMRKRKDRHLDSQHLADLRLHSALPVCHRRLSDSACFLAPRAASLSAPPAHLRAPTGR